MTSNKTEGTSVSFKEATEVVKLDSHTYRVNLEDAFCISAVPNGGYTASCMLAVAKTHLLSRNQPDTLTAHFEYPGQTAAGPAIVVIEDIKVSGRLSTLHLTLWQVALLPQAPWITPSVSRRIVFANTTNTNLRTFTGISMPTGYETSPAAMLPPLPDFDKLKIEGADDGWVESKLPTRFSSTARSLGNWGIYLPRDGPLVPGVLDLWIRMKSGEHITQGALTYVVDSCPLNLLLFLASPELRKLHDTTLDFVEKIQGKKIKDEQAGGLWFPTVVMNIEMKMALPEEGVEWLAVRFTSKQIRDGRFDLDVLVRDVEGEIVALSHQVAMILTMESTRKRKVSAKAAL